MATNNPMIGTQPISAIQSSPGSNSILGTRYELHLRAWMAEFRKNRAYKKLNKIQGINIEEQSNLNRQALKKRLGELTSPITEEMRTFLKTKLKANQILTPEEKVVFKKLMAGEWVLKHVTPDLKKIQEGGNKLLSLDERQRRGQDISNAHTNILEGSTDNVFLSFGPGNIPTVRFLDRVPSIIQGNYSELSQTPYSMHGLWSGGHIYAFLRNQVSDPVFIYGVKYQISYVDHLDDDKDTSLPLGSQEVSLPLGLDEKDQKETDEIFKKQPTLDKKQIQEQIHAQGKKQTQEKQTEEEQPTSERYKICSFEYPDGTIVKQILTMKDEIFIHPQLDTYYTLMVIEKFRLLGKEVWEKLMNADLLTLQQVAQTIFHSGVFEIHQPAIFNIEQPGMEVINRASQPTYDQHNSTLEKLILFALLGDNEKIMAELKQNKDLPIDRPIHFKSHSLHLLGAAILAGNLPLVTYLLNLDFVYNTPCSIKYESTDESPISCSPVGLTILLSNPLKALTIIRDMMPADLFHNIADQFKQRTINALPIARLLMNKGSVYQGNPNIFYPYSIEPLEIIFNTRKVQPDLKLIQELIMNTRLEEDDISLHFAIEHNSLPIAEYLLRKKLVDIECHFNNPNNIMTHGLTPLLYAAHQNNLPMVELLLKHNANPNASISTNLDTNETAIRVSEKEGYSALFFAVLHGNVEMVTLLLKNGARVQHLAANGWHVFRLAQEISGYLGDKRKGYENFYTNEKALLDLLEPAIRNIDPKAPPQPFLSLIKAAANYQIHYHITGIFLRSKTEEAGKKGYNYILDTNDPIIYFCPLKAFTQEHFKDTIEKMLSLPKGGADKTIFQELGTLYGSHDPGSMHYALQVLAVDIPNDVLQKFDAIMSLSKQPSMEMKLYSQTALEMQFSESKNKEEINNLQFKKVKFSIEIFKSLLKTTAASSWTQTQLIDFNKLFQEYISASHKAVSLAQAGDSVKLKALLQEGSINLNVSIVSTKPVNVTNPNLLKNTSLFSEAIEAEQYKVAEELFNLGASYSFDEKNEIAAKKLFEKIIENGHTTFYVTLIKKLKEQGMDPFSFLPLNHHYSRAIEHNQIDILNFLLSMQCDRTLMPTILEAAGRVCSIEIINTLIKHPVFIEQDYFTLWNALIDFYGQFDVSKYLQEKYGAEQTQKKFNVEELQEKHSRAVLTAAEILLPKVKLQSYHLGNIVKACLKRQDLQLLNKIQHFFQADMDLNWAIFARTDLEPELKQHGEFIQKLLATVIHPQGKWSVLVPLAQSLVTTDTGWNLYNDFVKNHYQSHAQLKQYREALLNEDLTNLDASLKRGMDENAYLLMPVEKQYNPYFRRPIEIVLNAGIISTKVLNRLLDIPTLDLQGISYLNLNNLVFQNKVDIFQRFLTIKPKHTLFWGHLADLKTTAESLKGHNIKETLTFLEEQHSKLTRFEQGVYSLDLKSAGELIVSVPETTVLKTLQEFLKTQCDINKLTGGVQSVVAHPAAAQAVVAQPTPAQSTLDVSKHIHLLNLLLDNINPASSLHDLVESLGHVCKTFPEQTQNLSKHLNSQSRQATLWSQAVRLLDLSLLRYLAQRNKANINTKLYLAVNFDSLKPTTFTALTPFFLFLKACAANFYSGKTKEALEALQIMLDGGADLTQTDSEENTVDTFIAKVLNSELKEGLRFGVNNHKFSKRGPNYKLENASSASGATAPALASTPAPAIVFTPAFNPAVPAGVATAVPGINQGSNPLPGSYPNHK